MTSTLAEPQTDTWTHVAKTSDFAATGRGCVKLGDAQIAIFNVDGAWYAVQNLCPHRQQMVLSRGLVGDAQGEPKVACPLHKNTFSLRTGEHLGGAYRLETYAVKEEAGEVYLSRRSM